MENKQYSLSDILSQFIWEHRKRFEVRHNNYFGFSFSDIQRYYSFLELIQEKFPALYDRNCRNAEKSLKIINKLKSSGPISDEHQVLIDEAIKISNEILFQVECFFLFSKILLDKIARSIELYFGPSSKLSLDSHDDLVKFFPKYCVVKDIELSDSFVSISKQLKEQVSDFRDYQIAHNKSPRTIKFPNLGKPKSASMKLSKLYPNDTDMQFESSETGNVLNLIEQYIVEVINLLKSNEEKTTLKRLHTK